MDSYRDEEGEPIVDYDDIQSDPGSPEPRQDLLDDFEDEVENWGQRERSQTPAYDTDKVGKPRKRLVKKGGSTGKESMDAPELLDEGEEGNFWRGGSDSDAKKRKKKEKKLKEKHYGGATEKGTVKKLGKSEEVNEMWEWVNPENDQEGTRTMDDDDFIDDSGVNPEDRYGSDNEARSPGAAPQAEEDDEDPEIKELFKMGKKRKKNEKSPAEIALLVESVMAELEVTAEEDAELNRQGKPAINKLKKLPLLTEVLSKKQLQPEFLDHGVLTLLKNWLEPLPDGSLPNINIRAAVLQILTDFPIDLEQHDRREQLKKSGLGKVIMFLSKSDEETTSNRKLAKELVDKWSRPIFNKSTRFEDMRNVEDDRVPLRRPSVKRHFPPFLSLFPFCPKERNMKHFMLPRNTILREPMENTPSSPNPTPSKSKRKHPKPSKENAPPPDPNSQPSPASTAKFKSQLPPRPPSSNPLKRKLYTETLPDNASLSGISDSGVKVVVRMRPPIKEEEEGDTIVQKVTSDSLSINGQTFTFDSVASSDATQLDIFQLVGAPLVENCLAGFNSSVFAYGQTGSGKTYTIWGPANALLEENLSSDQQGLTPRVFERLFARINEEQIKHADKQLKYQCRCSFLEIYNEQITDLLDPNQRNLQIREDVKSGVYVENLTEEYVSSMKDVTQLLIKGLSNRRTGATSINAESSRSHSVFTCVVESRCKSVADGVSSFKTSRINLVDLAGSERQKLTGAAGERLKEAGNINRSLSQLGNLINILAEVSQTGKQRHIPYRDSKLTFLLQESLGGNAKLAMVCAISPAQSCKSETFSTLRFAQRAKAIKNKAVVNEVMQDDVNFLREVIRQLKDELHRMKSDGNNQTDPNGSYSTGWNARRSLNLLKFSLHHPRTLPHVDEDGDEEMEIDEEAVEDLCAQIGLQPADIYLHSNELTKQEIIESISGNTTSENGCAGNLVPNSSETFKVQDAEDTDVNMEEEISEEPKTSEIMIVECVETATNMPNIFSAHESVKQDPCQLTVETTDGDSPAILKSPTPSVSPRVNQSRKSLRTSSMYSASQKDLRDDKPETMRVTPTEHLAASLHRGLEIIDSHRQSLALRRSSFRFSLKPADSKPILAARKVDVGVQTFPQEEDPVVFLCSNCTQRTNLDGKEDTENSNLQLVPVDESDSGEKTKKQVPKAVEKVLAGSIRREMALEEFCAKQASEIMQLNRLVQQYKHERECNAIIGQTREDKILRLESLMDGVLPTEEFMEEELVSLTHEHKLLKEKYENHPEVLRTKIELKRAQDELERFRNFHDLGEREVLLEEIQDLRNQLQYYIDPSSTSARRRNSLLKLTYSCEPNVPLPLRAIPETNEESAEEKFEQERIRWTEAEGKWISLAEELRTELDASKLLADKRKLELDMEKKCAEELKEAMQMAMAGHARMLEQYADLEEKHMQLLARHRNIQEGIDDVKKAAARAGVKGAESKFINALAAEISALKVEREKERRYLRDENRGLQAQLRDTAEAVQAAGELLVRLKEAEEAVAAAQKRAMESEQETEKAHRQIEKLKRKHEHEISSLNELLTESRLRKEGTQHAFDNVDLTKHDAGEFHDADSDQQWRQVFKPFYNGEDGALSKLEENSSWFSGYDRCNI